MFVGTVSIPNLAALYSLTVPANWMQACCESRSWDSCHRPTLAWSERCGRGLLWKGLVLRYDTQAADDGLPPGEGVFLPCSFWLADAYVLLGRRPEAEKLLKRLLALQNDVGLLSEEYDPVCKRMLGNFPQAFSHVALINTILNVTQEHGPAHQRSEMQGASQ